jgi:hypothetical protein
MKIRHYRESDFEILKQIHAKQGFDYDFPDISEAQFIVRAVYADDNDIPIQAILARQTVELYMLSDSSVGTPGERLEIFKELYGAVRAELKRLGVADVHAWLPPQVQKSFGRRLVKMFGFTESKWRCFWKAVD